MEQEDETKPLWRHVSKLRKTSGGGNNLIKCSLCDFSFNGSYTRVRAHLLQLKGEGVRSCPKVSSSKLVEFIENRDVKEKKGPSTTCIS